MKKLLVILSGLFALSSCLADNFAVLLAKDDPSAPAGMPTNWPVRIQPIGRAESLPSQFPPPWRFATGAQVEQWKANHAAEIEAWNLAREAESTAPKRDRDALIKQAKADLTAIIDTSGTLTGAQLSNAVRSMARTLRALLEDLGY
jgi:hypothetical protein